MQGHKELLLLIKLFDTFINDAIVLQDHPYITNFTVSTLYPPLFLGPGLFSDRAIAKEKIKALFSLIKSENSTPK